MTGNRPRVGIGVFIRKGDTVLLGKRFGKTSHGMYCPPGGKLDLYETPEDCAERETREEAGIEIHNLQFVCFTNNVHEEDGAHYITLMFVADWKAGEPTTTEPDKIGDWAWHQWHNLPEPLFMAARNFIEKGYNPFKI
jgi:8-oxo-dGTP diphosphatase